MSVNLVLVSGQVKSLAMKYDQQSRPELRFTLEQRDGEFTLWLPCCASGSAAERLAGELEDGQQIVITSAKLCYRKRQTKLGEQSRLEVLVWSIDRLSESPHIERSDAGEGSSGADDALNAPEPTSKKGKARYPKWKPEGLLSEN